MVASGRVRAGRSRILERHYLAKIIVLLERQQVCLVVVHLLDYRGPSAVPGQLRSITRLLSDTGSQSYSSDSR